MNIFASCKGNHVGKELPKPASNEEIRAELEKLTESHLSTKTKEGIAKDGDVVCIDFEGFLDGVPFEGGKGEKYDLELGSHTFIPGFEEQLIGHSKEEHVEVNVTFPKDYQAENLKGKDVVFKCFIHEVKQQVTPELNDAFAVELGLKDLEELKAAVKTRIEKNKQAKLNDEYLGKLMDELISKSTIDTTPEQIKAAKERIMAYYNNSLAQYGMTLDTYLASTGLGKKKFEDSLTAEAVKTAKSEAYTDYVARTQNLAPTEAEINQEIAMIKEYYHLDDAKVNELVSKQRDQLVADLTHEKVARFLLDNND